MRVLREANVKADDANGSVRRWLRGEGGEGRQERSLGRMDARQALVAPPAAHGAACMMPETPIHRQMGPMAHFIAQLLLGASAYANDAGHGSGPCRAPTL